METGNFVHVFTNVLGCDSIVTLPVTIYNAVAKTADPVESCVTYYWAEADTTILETGTFTHVFNTVHGCDSVVTMTVTIHPAEASTETPVVECDTYYWASADTTITTSGTYTHVFNTIHGCDSVVTLQATIYNSAATVKPAETECNLYYWAEADTTITTTGTYTHVFQTVHGCDSVVTFDVTINIPYVDTLEVKGYYGNRIIMVNRLEINAMPGWELDSIDNGEGYVKWYKMLGADPNPATDELVGTGYYYTMPDGEPIPAGIYYATVEIPASEGAMCGAIGTTELYTITAAAGAPALVPSLAKPGEDIKVINLDPETETIIRIYSTEGLLQGTYTTSGEDTFVLKADYDQGFYLVELITDGFKSTLRYIVK